MKILATIILALMMQTASAEVMQKHAIGCANKDDLRAINTREDIEVLTGTGRCAIAYDAIKVTIIDYGILVSKVRVFSNKTFVDVYTNTSNLK